MISNAVRKTRTIRELMHESAEVHLDAPALYFEKNENLSTVSFREYELETRKIAICFTREFGTGKVIALSGSLTKAWLMIFLGILYSGNIAVPMDLSNGETDTIHNLEKLKPDAIFTEKIYRLAGEKIKAAFPGFAVRTVEEFYEESLKTSVTDLDLQLLKVQKPEDTAMLIFTSGTTGSNKIVELTHRNICSNGLLAAIYMDSSYPVSSKMLSGLPVFHVYGITSTVFATLYRGFTLCIGGGSWTLRNDLQKFKPNILVAVPMIIHNFGKKMLPEEGVNETAEERKLRIQQAGAFFGGELGTVITGGAPIEPVYQQFFESLGIFLMNGYGITECSPIVSCDVPIFHRKGAIGKAGIEPEICSVKIDDGEICVKGETVSPGYWKEPDLNREVYTDGWFRTGDLGYLDEDNYLYITGRKKNILILPDGNNISMDELEKELEKCPEVDSAIVLGSVVKETAVIKAIVYLNPENGKSESDSRMAVKDWIDRMNKNGPRYKRIAEFEITDKPFERTALGKIQKYKYSAG